MVTTAEFISSFHSLQGITVEEKHKHFCQLLKRTLHSQKEGFQLIDFSCLHPKNVFEEKLKIEALIYFRSIPDLLEILQNGNPMHIAKVLKISNVFVDEAFRNITGEELVKNIFRRMSFNTKLKILNKLCLHLNDRQKAEDFFLAIRENYGLHLASKLIPCCSQEIIIKNMKENRLELTPAQLKLIVIRNPELVESLFDILNGYQAKVNVALKYHTVFRYLMQKDPALFLKLNKKYKPTFGLGHRATKSLIRLDQQNIVNNSKDIYRLLKKKQVARNLQQHFSNFFLNAFPPSLSQCESEYKEFLLFLQYMPSRAQRIKLLSSIFKNVYDSELWAHPSFITVQLMELISYDDRELLIETHSRPSTIPEEAWISFMKTEKSLPLLKKRISLTSNIKARARIIPHLVNTCKFNNDKVALLDCCKYMVTQHHNDHYLVRQGFLKTVMSRYCLKKLEEEHWMYINKLLNYGIVNNDNYYGNCDFLKAYIEYRLTQNLAIDNELEQWFQHNYGDLDIKNPKHQRLCLERRYKYIGINSEDEALHNEYVHYLHLLSEFNKAYPNHWITLSLYPVAIDHLKEALKENKYCYDGQFIIQQYISTESNIDETEKVILLNSLFMPKNQYISHSFIKWLLRNNPIYVVNNIGVIMTALFESKYRPNYIPLWKYLKYYTHLEIPQKICEICVKIVYTGDDDVQYYGLNKTESAIIALSHLMAPEDFINFIEPYYPAIAGTDVCTKEGRRMCKVQKSIVISLKDIVPPVLALDGILNFSKGDYLKYAQTSLQSVSHQVPEKTLVPFLNELSSRAVSVRKHAICFTFNSSNKADIYSLLTKLMKTEENTSIRKFLFKGIFNFFVKSPDDYTWNLLKRNVQALNLDDSESFQILTKWKRIPESYLGLYIAFTWDTIGKLPNPGERDEGRCKVLDAVTVAVIPMIPDKLGREIITKYLFKCKELTDFQLKLHSFVCKYIIYCKSPFEQDDRLQLTFTAIKDYVIESWYNSNTCVVGFKSVYSFVQEFTSNFLKNKSLNTEIFNKFVVLWNNFLKVDDALNVYVYLQLAGNCLKCTTLTEIAEAIVALYASLLKQHGSIIDNSFYQSLELLNSNFLLSEEVEVAEENRYILIHKIMEKGNAQETAMLVMCLLPKAVPTVPKFKIKYYNIVEVLLKDNNPHIKIYLWQYLINKQ